MEKIISKLPTFIEVYNTKVERVIRYYLTMKGYQTDKNKFFMGYINEQIKEGLEVSVSSSYNECAKELIKKIKKYAW